VTVLPQTPTPVITAGGSITFCAGGSVELISSAASSYLWTPGGQATQSVIVTTSGTYTVQTDNGTGCTAESLPVTVTVLPQTPTPVITAGGPITFCDGGSVELTSSAASSYLWTPGGQAPQSVIVTTSGTYTVQTDNGTGCTAESLPVTVTVLPQTPTPVITAGGPITFCAGGSVELTSSAASSYLWTPGGQATQSVIVTTSGTYTVQTDNGTGCTAESLPVTVTVNPLPAIPVITPSGPLTFCDGDSVILTASPSGIYLWYPSGATTQSITVTGSGTHYVEVSNGNCTSVSTPVTISILPVPAVPIITVNGSASLCSGDSVQLTSSPASAYLWYPGGETSQSIWVSTGGTYWVEVYNSSGCSSVSAAQTIVVHPNPSVTINGELVVCEGTTEIYTVSNMPSAEYYWTVSGASITGGSGTNSVEVLFTNQGNIQIEITVVDQNTGCSASHSISVTSLSAPEAYAGPDLSICEGDTIQLQAYGGTSYTWIPSVGLNNPDISDPLAFPVVTTQYIVEVANGSCTDRDTMLLTVYSLPVADAGPDAFIMQGDCVTLTGSGGTYYYWSPGTGLNSQTSATPESCPEETVSYVLVVTDGNGCSAEDEVTVFVTQYSGDIVFPNTISPNADGFNDTWIIDGLEAYPDHKLIIFNRWGNKVFDAQPYLNDWGGECIGKPLPDGTYYFVLDPGDGSEIVRSFITIIR
jgi:large repetitive protein